MRPKPINLDSLFGHTLMNLTGEPVTPTKVAIFYLVRTLFHAHFGVRAVPSLSPLKKEQKAKAFSVIYGLILLGEEVTYDEFRMFVRMLDNELGRSIYYPFVCSMEKLARGDEHIDMLFENAFYTSKRERHPKVLKRPIEMDALTFMNNKSYVFMWIKRVMMSYTRTPQSGLFEINENMKTWLISGSLKTVHLSRFGLDIKLPYDIDCSIRSRQWLKKQLKLVSFCPSQAAPYEQIMSWCKAIREHHPDVFDALLMMAVIHVMQKNPPGAVSCLKEFFDLSMLDISHDANKALKTFDLMARTQIALRYGPILQGRVMRIFGDHQSADFFFNESIQQAQLNDDIMCNRIANLELTANQVLNSGPIQEKPYNESDDTSDQALLDDDRRVAQSTIHVGADLDRPSIQIMRGGSFQENYEMHTYMLSISKLMLAIEDIMRGTYSRYHRSAVYVHVALNRLRLLYDRMYKARSIEDFAAAIVTSSSIINGMYQQAARAAETTLAHNCSSPSSPCMETESIAVVGVNLVYASAAVGNYEKAFKTISVLESMFPDELNWMGARHVRIASQLIRFERDFLKNRFTACDSHILGLQASSQLEYLLRKSLLFAITGKTSEAVTLLTDYKCGDARGKIRIQMQLATIHTANGEFEAAEAHLGEAEKMVLSVGFRDLNLLVARRVASLLLLRNKPYDAMQVLLAISVTIENYGTFIEKAIYYALMSRCLRLIGKDPRLYLKKCKLTIGNRWPGMKKLILAELAFLHSDDGLYPDEKKSAFALDQFVTIEMRYPGPCSWMFI